MGDSLQTADLNQALPYDPTTIAANAAATGGPAASPLGPPSGNALPQATRQRVERAPTNDNATPETNLTIARKQRQQGENPSGNPNAQNPHSSAGGKNQIIDDTWVALLTKNHPEMVEGKSRQEILALKNDGPLNDEMAGKYDQDNAKFLASNGIAPTPNFINAAYRAGPQGALAIIQAARANPATLVKDVAPDMAKPGNNGAGNMTVGQFLMNPYARGPGAEEGGSPQQMFTIAKGNQILADLQAELESGKARVAAIDKDYKPLEFDKPPKPPETDPLKTFGSLAGVFATLAAGFSRTPAIAAMNGLAGAMDAAKKADWDTYKANYDQFKYSSELMLKAHEQHSADVRDALEMMTKNMAAGTAMLNATVALSDDEEMHKLHETQRYVEMGQLQDKRDETAREVREKLPVSMATADLTAALENRKHAQEGGDPAEVAKAEELVTQAENRLAGVKRATAGAGGVTGLSNPVAVTVNGKPAMAIYDKNALSWRYPNGVPIPADAEVLPTGKPTAAAAKEGDAETLAHKAFVDKNGREPDLSDFNDKAEMAKLTTEQRNNATGGLTEEAADFAAERVLFGDESALTGMARSASNITKVNNAIVQKAKEYGLTPAQVAVKVAQFKGIVAGERTLGTRQANMEVAANEVKAMTPLALDASEHVDRTEFPTLNAVLLAAERGTGDENVVRFALAANSLIYSFSKFLNPTGIPTDADKARATEILATQWSKEQFTTALDQISKEIATGRFAIDATREEFLQGLVGGQGSTTAHTQPTAPKAPAIGTIEQGHRYKGGDPADPKSWEAVGGR